MDRPPPSCILFRSQALGEELEEKIADAISAAAAEQLGDASEDAAAPTMSELADQARRKRVYDQKRNLACALGCKATSDTSLPCFFR